MSVLGDVRIREAMGRGEIAIEPMHPDAIGSNSIDLHLSRHLAVYAGDEVLDSANIDERALYRFEIPVARRGLVLMPGQLYLGSTVERTKSGPYLPILEGTSSAGRLGMQVHCTAGVGDVGFEGHWTLEISVVRPIRVYGGEPVCQLLFLEVAGDVRTPYGSKAGANYQGQGHLPMPSQMWKKPRFLG